jgi:hypothetical protein
MISTTEFNAPSHETSRGRRGNSLGIVVRSVLVVAVMVAVIFWSAESPDLDLTGSPKVKECQLHHVPLVVARAPITYGDLSDWAKDYYRASKVSFPHAGTTVFASTLSRFSDYTDDTYRFARVSQCPECLRAEQQWSEAKAKLK